MQCWKVVYGRSHSIKMYSWNWNFGPLTPKPTPFHSSKIQSHHIMLAEKWPLNSLILREDPQLQYETVHGKNAWQATWLLSTFPNLKLFAP